MSRNANPGGEVPVTALCVPPVVPVLLNDATFREFVSDPPRRGRIGTAGPFVVVGVVDYQIAVEQDYEAVKAAPVVEADEDAAVVQMYAAKDLLPVAKNELAMGRAYVVTEQAIKMLPKQNTLKDKIAHRKRYGMRRSERRDVMWGEVFGVSKTNLRRYARALAAPPEVKRLFLAGHMHLDDVLNVVNAGPEVGRNVERDLLSGAAVADALERHLGTEAAANDDEPQQSKNTVVALVKSLNRWSKLFERLGKKRPELTREQDRALQKAEEFIARLRRKVG